jgi:hypothetical protein
LTFSFPDKTTGNGRGFGFVTFADSSGNYFRDSYHLIVSFAPSIFNRAQAYAVEVVQFVTRKFVWLTVADRVVAARHEIKGRSVIDPFNQISFSSRIFPDA